MGSLSCSCAGELSSRNSETVCWKYCGIHCAASMMGTFDCTNLAVRVATTGGPGVRTPSCRTNAAARPAISTNFCRAGGMRKAAANAAFTSMISNDNP